RAARSGPAQEAGKTRPGYQLGLVVLCGVVEGSTRHNSTEARGLPGAFEGETVTRRRLMTGTAHTAGAIAAASFTLPALAFAIGPVFDRTTATWQPIGPVSDFK